MAANSGAIRAGRAFVEFFANDVLLLRSLDTIKKRLQELGNFSIKIGQGLTGAGRSIHSPLTSLFTQAAEHARDIGSLSAQFSSTTESISGLAAGFQGAGVSFENFRGILDGLADRILNNDELLQQMQISTFKLAQMPIGAALDEVADAFSRMTNPMQQAYFGTKIFGDSFRLLQPYLKEGAAGMARLREEGKEFAIDPERVKRGTEVMQGMNRIMTAFRYTLLDVGAALLPNAESIKNTVRWITKAGASIKEFISRNKETIKVVATVGAGLVAAGTALIAFGSIVTATASTIGLVTSVVGGIATVFASLPALIAVGTAALAGFFAYQIGAGQESTGILESGFNDLRDTAIKTWEGIGAAVGKGDFAKAFAIAAKGLELAWAQTVAALSDLWYGFLDILNKGKESALSVFKIFSVNATAWVGKQFTGAETSGEIERRRALVEKELMLEHSRATAGGGRADRTRIGQLEAELAELRDSIEAGKGWFEKIKEAQEATGSEDFGARNALTIGTSTKGGFSAVAAAQQFGIGDKTDRMIEGINTTNQNLRDLRGDIKDLGTGLRLR